MITQVQVMLFWQVQVNPLSSQNPVSDSRKIRNSHHPANNRKGQARWQGRCQEMLQIAAELPSRTGLAEAITKQILHANGIQVPQGELLQKFHCRFGVGRVSAGSHFFWKRIGASLPKLIGIFVSPPNSVESWEFPNPQAAPLILGASA